MVTIFEVSSGLWDRERLFFFLFGRLLGRSLSRGQFRSMELTRIARGKVSLCVEYLEVHFGWPGY